MSEFYECFYIFAFIRVIRQFANIRVVDKICAHTLQIFLLSPPYSFLPTL